MKSLPVGSTLRDKSVSPYTVKVLAKVHSTEMGETVPSSVSGEEKNSAI